MRAVKQAFSGPLIDDIATWGGAGAAIGVAVGFWGGLARWACTGDLDRNELGWLTVVATGTLTSLGLTVALLGHLFAAIG